MKVSGGGLNGHVFENITRAENLFAAWREFRRGKRGKFEVQQFEYVLEDYIFQLRDDLVFGRYAPLPYTDFYINDPKRRHIHKAHIRDRVLHQAVFRVLYPLFDRGFIYDSYSSRVGKGTHAAVLRLETFLRKTSRNMRRPAFVLKCDIARFFDSVDHAILLSLLRGKIADCRAFCLVEQIVRGFETTAGKGLPLGNVTSQLFANIYLNELDQFMKCTLRLWRFVRYCDDFAIVLDKKGDFPEIIRLLRSFLTGQLKLTLHSKKIIIRSYVQGVDFLGYVLRPYHRTLRTRTKRRMLRRVCAENASSYLGVLEHCAGFKIRKTVFDKLTVQ